MATSNSNLTLVGTDFDQIKSNLLTFLRGQDVLKDADYTGSVLQTLLDVLAYNTHYNAFYLNMVANEMFLDSAVKRASVISHSKMLGYFPRSVVAPTATIKLTITNYELPSITIPKFTKFISESVDGVNYVFMTDKEYVVNNDPNNNPNTAIVITDVIVKQGEPVQYTFTYNLKENPKGIYKIPDANIDLSTLQVIVQKSRLDFSSVSFYTGSTETLSITPESEIYFVQESMDGFYEIYFGDGVLGKQLENGNVVIVSYITSDGSIANGAKEFTIVGGNEQLASGIISVETTSPAFGGREKESIESIKFIAPKSYSAQNRAVTNQDYMTLLNNNNYGFIFDSVNVWGGQENDPPVYGQVFVSLKPQGGYTLTTSQKEIIKTKLIKPLNVITVEPTIIDPDYTYIKLEVDVLYDSRKTILSVGELDTVIRSAIQEFSRETLNSFNSTFSYPDLMFAVQNADNSIVTNEIDVTLQKKFLPSLEVATTYELEFGSVLERGILFSGIASSPSMQYYDRQNSYTVIDGIYLEELPSYSGGVESIDIINPGFGYKTNPSIKIVGDGSGANAYSIVVNGSLSKIVVDSPGANYSQAIIEIEGGGGTLGQATATLQGRYGTIKSYYYNKKNIKTSFNENVGVVDYYTGKVTLTDFNPLNVNNPLAQLTISAKPQSNIISSSRNRILTIDQFDPSAIVINIKEKS
jgi:hypothetical protein